MGESEDPPKEVRQPEMGVDHGADRRTRRRRRIAQKRLWNEFRKLTQRRQTIVRRLKQIDAVLRSLVASDASTTLAAADGHKPI